MRKVKVKEELAGSGLLADRRADCQRGNEK
jgi:hypothetical protein